MHTSLGEEHTSCELMCAVVICGLPESFLMSLLGARICLKREWLHLPNSSDILRRWLCVVTLGVFGHSHIPPWIARCRCVQTWWSAAWRHPDLISSRVEIKSDNPMFFAHLVLVEDDFEVFCGVVLVQLCQTKSLEQLQSLKCSRIYA